MTTRRYGGESAWGGKFDDEIDRSSGIYAGTYDKGTVAMANSGPNTNGSQFFIMHVDYGLPPSYTKFGRVIEGQCLDCNGGRQECRARMPAPQGDHYDLGEQWEG